MSFTTASSINISGVQDVIEVYVRYLNGALALFKEDNCSNSFSPANLNVAKQTPTGLYFYISSQSPTGTKFPDGTGGAPSPITWKTGQCPSTVTYELFRNDSKAFSLKDEYNHPNIAHHEFDINVELPNGKHMNVFLVEGIDPTIVEVGEDPPGEHPTS